MDPPGSPLPLLFPPLQFSVPWPQAPAVPKLSEPARAVTPPWPWHLVLAWKDLTRLASITPILINWIMVDFTSAPPSPR